MESICRLCCSTKFVNNNLFDEENALYLKMELYLPFKVKKMDRLPQKVCDRCSCKVNDLYQFCNEAIEAQDRLREMMRHVETNLNDSVDLTLTKQETIAPSPAACSRREQGTQTELATEPTQSSNKPNVEVQIKVEPTSLSPSEVKSENKEEMEVESNNHFDNPVDLPTDNSDDNVSLISLKKKKRGRKPNANGEAKRGRKKKPKDWEQLINTLPNDTAVTMVEKPTVPIPMDVMKEEVVFGYKEEAPDLLVKREPNEDMYQCCICFMQCFNRNDMLQHYREHVDASEAWGAPPPAPPPPDQQPLRCVRCRKVVEPEEWAAHWQRHWERDRRPYTCALCEKTFRDPHQILKHGQTHKSGEALSNTQELTKRFVCDLCPESFVYMRYLLAHRARAHPEAAARALTLRCAVCARAFAHLNSLRRHLRAHSGERNHLCNVCGKALTSREHLKFHIRIHTGYKPNVCK
ncbi:zinc finger and SCAN domain-containing protein 10-like [Ostrinia nubilalis]|uniref:zinc finger and SCAN domain-containing protein 10-like n=1 Tax=Ostrinia nubilalis TaxID=29057 RepID=UPI0030826497